MAQPLARRASAKISRTARSEPLASLHAFGASERQHPVAARVDLRLFPGSPGKLSQRGDDVREQRLDHADEVSLQ